MEIYQNEWKKKKSKYDVNGNDNLCFWKSFALYQHYEKGIERSDKCLTLAKETNMQILQFWKLA